MAVKDEGGVLPPGKSGLHVIPAHCTPRATQVLRPRQREILLSGDSRRILDAAVRSGGQPVPDFARHIPELRRAFYRRAATVRSPDKVLPTLARKVRQSDIEMIVPQHGPFFKGKDVQPVHRPDHSPVALTCSEANYMPPQSRV